MRIKRLITQSCQSTEDVALSNWGGGVGFDDCPFNSVLDENKVILLRPHNNILLILAFSNLGGGGGFVDCPFNSVLDENKVFLLRPHNNTLLVLAFSNQNAVVIFVGVAEMLFKTPPAPSFAQ